MPGDYTGPWHTGKGSLMTGIRRILLMMLLVAGCSYPELVKRGEDAPAADKCGDCHIEIYREWKESPHAGSFSNPEFRAATYNYQFVFCLGCHAPESIYIPAKGQDYPSSPRVRKARREEGVNCNGCHLTEDCKLAGPLKAMAPHPVGEGHELYKRSVLCGTCHRGTFNEWQAVSREDKESCQDCHMPASQEKLIQDAPWRWLYRKKDTKRHTFSTDDGLKALEQPINIEVKITQVTKAAAVGFVELENLSIPHSIPTGDYGYREVVLRIEVEDSSGDKGLLKEESFFREMDTAIGYGERKSVKFSIPGEKNTAGTRLIITLFRRSFDGKVEAVLAQVKVPLEQTL